MPAQPLTPMQLSDAARLKSLYERWKERRRTNGEPSSQETVAAMLGINSQSTVSQYVNGKIPLNPKALVKFAELLEVPPEDISPALVLEIEKIAGAVPEARIATPTDAEFNSGFAPIRQVVFKISAGIAGFSVEFTEQDAEE